jgi:acyl carrier protein
MANDSSVSRDEIEARVRDITAVVLGLDPRTINDASSSQTMPAWSSLAHMNLVLALEDEFGIEFEERIIPEVMSFRRLCDALAARVPGAL